jgi:hypothetical protein
MRKLLVTACLAAFAAAASAQVGISPGDTPQSVLAAQKGKPVTVRLRGGQELTGSVRDVNARVVVLGPVSGREFFDAVVPLEAIDAILIRTK